MHLLDPARRVGKELDLRPTRAERGRRRSRRNAPRAPAGTCRRAGCRASAGGRRCARQRRLTRRPGRAAGSGRGRGRGARAEAPRRAGRAYRRPARSAARSRTQPRRGNALPAPGSSAVTTIVGWSPNGIASNTSPEKDSRPGREPIPVVWWSMSFRVHAAKVAARRDGSGSVDRRCLTHRDDVVALDERREALIHPRLGCLDVLRTEAADPARQATAGIRPRCSQRRIVFSLTPRARAASRTCIKAMACCSLVGIPRG